MDVTRKMTESEEVWNLWNDIAAINAWLDSSVPPGLSSAHDDAMRIMKIGEEMGEAIQAYIGVVGQNPRKGVESTMGAVLMELADCAITALCAIQHFTQNTAYTRGIVASKVTSVLSRI